MGKYKYSATDSGYQAWLADGNEGDWLTFLDALEKGYERETLIDKINKELRRMPTYRLAELLDYIEEF